MTDKPLPGWLRFLRVFWAVFLLGLLAFSVTMAAWGDMREALMLRVVADRYNKSFTIQAPEGAKVWVGEAFLGESQVHELSAGEPEDSALEVEGMSVLLPRVYLREEQLMKNAVMCEPEQDVPAVVEKLAPGSEILWGDTSDLTGPGFRPLLLNNEYCERDFVNLGRVDFPSHDHGEVRAAFLMRMSSKEGRVCLHDRTEIWTDQVFAPDGEWWAVREQYDSMPPRLSGQTKTVWRWFFESPGEEWIDEHLQGDREWARLPPED